MREALLRTDFRGFALRRGKVRDIYDLGENLLIVATDRISAFDVVMPNGIPDKGVILNSLSEFWFRRTAHITASHLISTDVEDFEALSPEGRNLVRGRAMLVKKAEPIPVECVVRGYLAGSGWKSYRENGTLWGIELPPNLRQASRLPEPLFTPATKAASGHDENITFKDVVNLAGKDVARFIADKSMQIYKEASDYARSCGIIISDTKFEWGFCKGEIILIDELLTPDSSRFWPADSYKEGTSPVSFDKQFARDYLENIGWNKQPPAPTLPEEIVRKTREKYVEAYRRLVGKEPPVGV